VGEDISHAIALQLGKEMSAAHLKMDGKLEQIYLEPEAAPAVSISSDNDTDSTLSNGDYDAKCDSGVHKRVEDFVDARKLSI
jgi:hypothetical protein